MNTPNRVLPTERITHLSHNIQSTSHSIHNYSTAVIQLPVTRLERRRVSFHSHTHRSPDMINKAHTMKRRCRTSIFQAQINTKKRFFFHERFFGQSKMILLWHRSENNRSEHLFLRVNKNIVQWSIIVIQGPPATVWSQTNVWGKNLICIKQKK